MTTEYVEPEDQTQGDAANFFYDEFTNLYYDETSRLYFDSSEVPYRYYHYNPSVKDYMPVTMPVERWEEWGGYLEYVFSYLYVALLFSILFSS